MGVVGYEVSSSDELADLIRSANSPVVPTFILDIGRQTLDDSLYSIATAVKGIVHDQRIARVILIFSDASAIFTIPEDQNRQKFIWVGDFTVDEANALFNKLDFLSDDTDLAHKSRQKLFSTIGTRVANLLNAIDRIKNDGMTVEAYIDFVHKRANATLICLLNSKPELKVLVDLLLNSGPQGVQLSQLPEGFPNPRVVAQSLKEYHALIFNAQENTYFFSSPAHRAVASKRRSLETVVV